MLCIPKVEKSTDEDMAEQELTIGARFHSYRNLQTALSKFSQETNSVYVIFNSKSIESENKHRPPDRQLPTCLKYKHIKFACKHYGSVRSKSRGLRPNQSSFKIGCPAYIYLAVQNNELVVEKMETEHSHVCDPDVVSYYPERRSISSERARLSADADSVNDAESELLQSVREDVMDLLQMSIDRRRIRNYVRLSTNKVLMSTDLSNFSKQVQGQERHISEERSFQLLNRLMALESKENSPAHIMDEYMRREKYKTLKRRVSHVRAEPGANSKEDGDHDGSAPEHGYSSASPKRPLRARRIQSTGKSVDEKNQVLVQSQGLQWDANSLEEMVKTFINPNEDGPVVVHLNNYDGVMVVEVPDGQGSVTQLEGTVVEVQDSQISDWDSENARDVGEDSTLEVLKSSTKSSKNSTSDEGASPGSLRTKRVLQFRKRQAVVDPSRSPTGPKSIEGSASKSPIEKNFVVEDMQHETAQVEVKSVITIEEQVEENREISNDDDGDYDDYNSGNECEDADVEVVSEVTNCPPERDDPASEGLQRIKLEAETAMLKAKTDKLRLQVKYLQSELGKQELEKEKLRLEIFLLKHRVGTQVIS